MQVQVHTGKQIDGGENFNEYVVAEIESGLKRFAERITRVEVHFADENSSSKSSDDDKRCVLEARLTGMQPISVTAHAASVRFALDGALEKMKSTLGRTLDKLSQTKGRPSLGELPGAEI
jgi:ribosomal subunit interface protein